MTFVTYNGVLSLPGISDRLLGYYLLSLYHHHIFALSMITSACQHELRLLLFVCVCVCVCACGARGGEYILSLVTLSLAKSCICMGKHIRVIYIQQIMRKQDISSTNSAFLISLKYL